MLNVLIYSFNAIAPILGLVLLGYFLKNKGVFTKEFLKVANHFNFHYCLCALMFCNIYALDTLDTIDWKLGGFVLCSLGVLTAVGFVIANLMTNVHNRKGVLIQAAFRSNFAVIGIPLVQSLGSVSAIALVSAMQAPAVIYFNLMAVVVLSIYSGDEQHVDIKKTVMGIAGNPMIRGLVLGLVALALREVIPRNADGALVFSLSGSLPWLYSVLESLSRIATPMALIILGGQFEFKAVAGVKKELLTGLVMRLLLAPFVGISLAFFAARLGIIQMSADISAVLLALYGTPVAVSSAVMATEMKADDVLAGQLVVWTTLLSLVTLFFLIAGFRFAGLL